MSVVVSTLGTCSFPRRLVSCGLQAFDAASLAAALKQNTVLTKLESAMGQWGGTSTVLCIPSQCYTSNESIHSSLGSNSIGGKGAERLAEALKYNTTLTDLEYVNTCEGRT